MSDVSADAPPPIEDHAAFEFVRALGGIEEYRHRSNALTVLLLEDRAAPVAAFQVTYRVGSRNEGAGLTGATHLLEHLMFKGTERFNRESGTSIFQTLQSVGGQINATTWYDRTNYYAMLPSEHIELAIEIEADRMRGARVGADDLASERTVVLNELDRGENEPMRSLFHGVYATAFQAHPYKHPVIGWRSDVETMTAEGLRTFYDSYYWPSNATASVAGFFDRREVLYLIDRHFGAIPRGPKQSEDASAPLPDLERVTREPDQRGERRYMLRKSGELGGVVLAYKAPAGLDEQADALDVLVQVLAAGKSSRLYRQLTDKGLTTSAFAYFPRLRDPGLFMLYGALSTDVEHAAVEEELKSALADIAENGLTDTEVARARRQVVADDAFDRDGPYSVLSQLNEAIAVGDWTLFAEFPTRIEAVTPEQVQAAAAAILSDDQLTVGWYIPILPDAAASSTPGNESDS